MFSPTFSKSQCNDLSASFPYTQLCFAKTSGFAFAFDAQATLLEIKLPILFYFILVIVILQDL